MTNVFDLEEWRAIPGLEGFHEVSSHGRIRSIDRVVTTGGRYGPQQRRYKGRIKKLSGGGNNIYLSICLTTPTKIVSNTVHSFVLQAFVGSCPDGQEALHRDCDSTNNRLDNLRYGTRKENREDSRKQETLAVGSKIAQSKLTEDQVREMRRTGNFDADAYGMSPRQMRRIRSGEHWKHV